jgi:hypothetical protein
MASWHAPCHIYLESCKTSLTENRHEIRDCDVAKLLRRLPGDLRNGTRLHAGLSHQPETFTQRFRRTIMKFETAMLHSLFAACLVICVTMLGSLLA